MRCKGDEFDERKRYLEAFNPVEKLQVIEGAKGKTKKPPHKPDVWDWAIPIASFQFVWKWSQCHHPLRQSRQPRRPHSVLWAQQCPGSVLQSASADVREALKPDTAIPCVQCDASGQHQATRRSFYPEARALVQGKQYSLVSPVLFKQIDSMSLK